MFATLLGALPRPLGPDGRPISDDDTAVGAALEAQGAAGIEPLTDGRLRGHGPFSHIASGDRQDRPGDTLEGVPAWDPSLVVRDWQFASRTATGLVKQALPGPYTLGRRIEGTDRDTTTLAYARVLQAQILVLADAGCQLIEIEEPDAHLIGVAAVERARFAEAHALMLEGVSGVHCSLAITGGNADTAGIETILGAPYASLAVNLIDGPDNWRLVTSAPGDRGIVCGVVSTRESSDDAPDLMLWAAAYASASEGRGATRVGLGTAAGFETLTWDVAVRKMRALGEAARLAQLPPSEMAAHLDPRAIDIKSAAMGRYVPRSGRRPRRPLP